MIRHRDEWLEKSPGAIKQQVISKDQSITAAGNEQWPDSKPESCYFIGSESTGHGHVTVLGKKRQGAMVSRSNL